MNLIEFSAPIMFGEIDTKISDDIKKSIGTLNDTVIIGFDDTSEWTIDIDNPMLIESYKPPFYNRRGEYAHKHSYFEALCHASTWYDRHRLIDSSNARYAVRYEKACDTILYPANIQIMAFVEQLHKKNVRFMCDLFDALKDGGIPHYEEIVKGLFRNVAIQIHFNKKSLSAEETLHTDHINSLLHMAVTLNGTRKILFVNINDNNRDKQLLDLKQNDVYLTSPTYIPHGIEIPQLDEKDASIAIQFRTLLSTKVASELYKNYTRKVCEIVCDTLKKYNGRFELPTYEEYVNEVDQIIKNAPVVDDDTPKKIKYTNKSLYFV